jgi:MoaA/NifB/PqqE/SkfB family radical SAM enzyme
MTEFNLLPQYKYTLNSMPRGLEDDQVVNNTCNRPSKLVTINWNLDCLICDCDGWLPIPVGKVSDFDSLEDVWNSDIAKTLQKDVADKKFTWCAVKHCGIAKRNIIEPKYKIYINTDESCNLACPSCRSNSIMITSGPVFDSKLNATNKIISWLEKFPHPIHIVLSGNGDPLASSIIRPLIQNYKPKPGQSFRLFTNGLLIKKQLTDSSLLPYIAEFSISVDAGSKEVYENVRRPGKWEVLIENLDFIKNNNFIKNKQVWLNFVVQKNNYLDLYNFADLCKKYKFKGSITRLDDWATWKDQFHVHEVLNKSHPEYEQCIAVLKDISSNTNVRLSPIVNNILKNE